MRLKNETLERVAKTFDIKESVAEFVEKSFDYEYKISFRSDGIVDMMIEITS